MLILPYTVQGVADSGRFNSTLTLIRKTLNQNNPVDFLVVGAAKSGTTTLFEALNEHPLIFIPHRKECRYFSCMSGDYAGPKPVSPNEIIQSLEEYQGLFERAKPGQLCGDISPDYLYFYQNAVPKIRNEVNAQVPIIIVLRNPIDRAYSHYLENVRLRRETLSFEAALDAEEARRAANWGWGLIYTDVGLYAEQVKAYTDNFERVLLLLFEEDIVTGRATEKILDFLNLDSLSESRADIHANVSGYPQKRWLHRLMTDELIVRKVKDVIKATPLYTSPIYTGLRRYYQKMMKANLKKVAMAAQTRHLLKEKFQEDVALLAEYTKLPVYEYWTDFQ